MPACLRSLILILWLGVFAAPGAHAAATIIIVRSERSAAYAEAAEALVSELERGGLPRQEVVQQLAAEWSGPGALAPKLFVALGSEAATVLARSELHAPVLAALLPRNSFQRVLLQSGRKASTQFSALYLDQPLSRQLELVRLALPNARRIGVLWGPESQVQAAAMKLLVQARGLALVEASVGGDEPVFSGLKRVLQEADVLLAIPDPQVFSSTTIQNILLASFRSRVPMVAFSPAYVRAGALFALHVTPTQIGQQAATLALGVLQGKALPVAPLYPQDFSVVVNEHVARSLGLNLDASVLSSQLHRRETMP